jgi:hypothetical protein
MAHPNEDLLRRGYEAFATGDIDTVLSVFSHDIAWHVGGSNQTSGEYHGHQEVMGFFVKLMELSGGSFRLDVHDILGMTRMAPCSRPPTVRGTGSSWRPGKSTSGTWRTARPRNSGPSRKIRRPSTGSSANPAAQHIAPSAA